MAGRDKRARSDHDPFCETFFRPQGSTMSASSAPSWWYVHALSILMCGVSIRGKRL